MSPRNSAQNEAQRSQTRQAILMAGLKAFAEKGYAAASMSFIAKEAGISKGLSYHYFQSKEDLLHGILEMLMSMADGLESMWEGKTPAEKLSLTIEMTFQIVQEQPDTIRFMTALALQPDVTEQIKGMVLKQKLANMFIYEDIFRALGYSDPRNEAFAFGALLDGMVMGVLALGEDYPLLDVKQIILTKYELWKPPLLAWA